MHVVPITILADSELDLRWKSLKEMSSSSGFLPAIKTTKSSLPSAIRVYAAMDYLERASANRLHKKKRRKGTRKRARTITPKGEVQGGEKSVRSKEYSKELKVRKEKAKAVRAKEEECRKHHEELKTKGVREKTRLNQLFSIYATQHGDSYRSSARVTRPKFPNLLKSTSTNVSPKDKLEHASPVLSVSFEGNKMEK